MNGYSSDNFILNMGGFAIVLASILVGAVALMLAFLCLKACNKSARVQAAFTKVKEIVFWSLLLQTCIHSYIKTAIAALLGLDQSEWTDGSSWVVSAAYLVGFPFFVTMYNWKHLEEIKFVYHEKYSLRKRVAQIEETDTIQEPIYRFKPIWEGFVPTRRLSLVYYTIFCYRRLLYVVTVVFLAPFPSL